MGNPFLKIINVGQGDCLILQPNEGRYNDHDIYIDLGPGNVNVTKYSENSKKVLTLSHSHEDHIGGIKDFIRFNQLKQIEEIWLPLQWEEIFKIKQYILKLKGIEVVNSISYYKLLSDYYLSVFISDKIKSHNIKVTGIFEGRKIAKNIDVFNPPVNFTLISERDAEKFILKMRNERYESIKSWFDEETFFLLLKDMDSKYYKELRSKEQKGLEDSNYKQDKYHEEEYLLNEENWSLKQRELFIQSFIAYLYNYIDRFVKNPKNYNFSLIYNKLEETSNDCSIVWKYSSTSIAVNILFTGDAGKKVFKRLINKQASLQAHILKVPHHGSKNNLNEEILKYISPQVAIVSHDNRQFGSGEPHPHQKVIDLLDNCSDTTTIIYTNDVIKKGKVVRTKPKPKPKPKHLYNNIYCYYDKI